MSLADCHKESGAVVCLRLSCGKRRIFIAIQRRHLIIASKSLRLFVVALNAEKEETRLAYRAKFPFAAI